LGFFVFDGFVKCVEVLGVEFLFIGIIVWK